MEYKKTYLGFEEIKDISPEQYMNNNNGKLFLLISPSCYNEKQKGNYRAMLKFKNSTKLITKNLIDTSDSGECSLIGILDSLEVINTPNVELNIITGIGLGFHGTIYKGKSSHKELVYKLLDIANNKDIKIKELVFKGNSNDIKNLIDKAFPLSKVKNNPLEEKTINLQKYTDVMQEQIKQQVIKDIVSNMSNLRFNKETISKVCMIQIEEVKQILNL